MSSEEAGYSLSKSPYYRSINKNLLKPCRQMGLPRSKKLSLNNSSNNSKNQTNLSREEETSSVKPKLDINEPTNIDINNTDPSEDSRKGEPNKTQTIKSKKSLKISKTTKETKNDDASNAPTSKLESVIKETNKPLIESKIKSSDKKQSENLKIDKKIKDKTAKTSAKRLFSDDSDSDENSRKKIAKKTPLNNKEPKIIEKDKKIEDTIEPSKKCKDLFIRLESIDLEDKNPNVLKDNQKAKILAFDSDNLLINDSSPTVTTKNTTKNDKSPSREFDKILKTNSNENIKNIPQLQTESTKRDQDLLNKTTLDDSFKGFEIKQHTTSDKSLINDKKSENDQSPIESNKLKKKPIKKLLSLKKSKSTNTNDEIEEITLNSTFSSNSTPNSQNDLTRNSYEKKEDEFMSELILEDKIIKLQRSVKEKQEKLSKLQQASIYQKMHNITELEDLTKIWKTGCKLALNDLLMRLKEHGTMEMTTLLDNLRIPEDLIKISPDGELI